MKENVLGITHESLLNILENELINIDYKVELMSAMSPYFSVSCSIESTTNGRKVVRIGEVNLDALDKKSQNYDFICSHPLFTAMKYAIDTAVTAYLGISSSYAENSIQEEEKNIFVETNLGGCNVQFKDNMVRVTTSNSPLKIAVKQGFIKSPGEVIIGIPDRLVVKVVGDSENDSDVDFVAR